MMFKIIPNYTVPTKYILLSDSQKNSKFIGQIESVKAKRYKSNIANKHITNRVLFKIYDAKVFSEFGIIISPNYLIVSDEVKLYSVNSEKEIYNVVYDLSVPLLNFGKTIHLDSALLLIDHGPNNYYHWFFDIMLKLLDIEDKRLKIKDVIIQAPKMNFQRETLEKISNKYNIHYLDRKLKYKIQNALISKNSFKNNKIVVDLIENINFLKRLLFVEKKTDSNIELIYISREKTTNGRNIINQDQLYDYLISKSFVIVRLERLTLDEQLNLFSKAKIIIAPHGAGLTNLITTQKGSHLIELLHVNRPSDLFKRLALTLGINYSSLIDSSPNKSHDPNILVDLIHLDNILRQLLK